MVEVIEETYSNILNARFHSMPGKTMASLNNRFGFSSPQVPFHNLYPLSNLLFFLFFFCQYNFLISISFVLLNLINNKTADSFGEKITLEMYSCIRQNIMCCCDRTQLSSNDNNKLSTTKIILSSSAIVSTVA